ncbi:YhjD/YihY/BrkB family envelope integrity protein [Dermacoccaceae bacterium W4C1]
MSLMTETAVERPVGEVPQVDAKPDWKVAFKRAAAKFSLDQSTDTAAQLTYYAIFSIFPALAAFVSMVSLIAEPSDIMKVITDVTGKSASELDSVNTIIENFAGSSGAGVALILGVLTSLWSASGYVGGFSRAMNRIYDIGEGRSVFKLRPWLYLVTILIAIGMLLIFAAVGLSGSIAKSIGDSIGLGQTAVDVFNIVKWPIVALIVVLIISLLYGATPNVRKPRRMYFSWGALVAFVLIIVASAAFGLYVALSAGASYNKTFGPFATAVLFLFYVWLMNNVLLFGAELDAELERTRQLKSGLPAEEMILLPARDESGLEKKAEKLEKQIEDAHELRLNSGKDVDELGVPYTPLDLRSRSSERTAAALESGAESPNRPATAHRDGASAGRRALVAEDGVARSSVAASAAGDEVHPETSRRGTEGSPVSAGTPSPEQLRRDVDQARSARRDEALTEATRSRKVRSRLEAQEKKAAEASKKAAKEAEAERKAAEESITREERWAAVEQGRAQYAPRDSADRNAVLAERDERRSQFKAEQAKKAAEKREIAAAAERAESAGDAGASLAPDPAEKNDGPMPSELRDQVTRERLERRSTHFAARPARVLEEVPLKFRRDRRSKS